MRVCVDSGYCMQEFDVSYHHNVMVKRKKRLVVLLALDSPSDLYANDASDTAALRQYLRQYTYIDYTADDWLDNLMYALPLRGLLHADQNMNMNVGGQQSGYIQVDHSLQDQQRLSFYCEDKDVPILQ